MGVVFVKWETGNGKRFPFPVSRFPFPTSR